MLKVVSERMVEWGDCDPAGIIFNPNILRYFDNNLTLLYRAAGWSKTEMMTKFSIIGCPVVEHVVKYYQPLRFEDMAQIETEVIDIGRSSFLLEHRIFRDGTLCVKASDRRVWTGRDPQTGRPVSNPIPGDVVKALSRLGKGFVRLQTARSPDSDAPESSSPEPT